MSLFARLKPPLLTLALMCLMVLVRVLYGAYDELEQGKRALGEGRSDDAIIHLERSLHWYLPLSPTTEQALGALWQIGQRLEAAGNVSEALEAYQALRAGLFATRSFYTPHPEWIARANERIAGLQVAMPNGTWPDPVLSEAERLSIALEVLQRDDAPRPGWAAVSVFGFLGWVGCALGFIWAAFDEHGLFLRRPGLLWGTGVVAAWLAWVVGLMRA